MEKEHIHPLVEILVAETSAPVATDSPGKAGMDSGRQRANARKGQQEEDNTPTKPHQQSDSDRLTPSQEILLAKRIENGDRTAKEKLVRANLRLVGAVAQRYQGQGLPLEDLMQEGTLGLLEAAERFNWRKGFRFSTYAFPWIRKAITRAIANSGRTIRLPVYVADTIARLTHVRSSLENELGRRPTRAELAQAAGMPEQQVTELLQNMTQPVSLDQPIGEGEGTLAEFLPAGESQNPSTRIFRRALQEEIARALKTLSPREQEVLRLRYGLHGVAPYTLEEIGRTLHISRERVRQIEAQALEKLRCGRMGKSLQETLLAA